jgi:hypothetical protein
MVARVAVGAESAAAAAHPMKMSPTIAILAFLLGAAEIIYKNGFWGLLLIAFGVLCLVVSETK